MGYTDTTTSEVITVTTKSAYSIRRTTSLSFDDADTAVRNALKEQGFGVLTEIDVQATLKEKLGEEMDPYRILGACNPPLAHRAVNAEPAIGVLLPCNVVVRVEHGQTVVEAMDPSAAMSLASSPGITQVAGEVRQKLLAVLEGLPA
ncbi:MAG: DUF302 domain-containing protein [Dehalococcoidia bacterium]|nr:DUF302 domain-containing protein [Dehalococcoidia bacterium]